jgi:Type III secretion protein YscO
MIAQLRVLLRVKELKEEKAFRAVNARRREVSEALTVMENARTAMVENAATIPAREDAIYREIMGRTVTFDEIDETKGKMQLIENEHAKLADAAQRAAHVHSRLEKQLALAVETHRQAVKDRDKYLILTEEVSTGLSNLTSQREETEVEDLFSTRRRRLA